MPLFSIETEALKKRFGEEQCGRFHLRHVFRSFPVFQDIHLLILKTTIRLSGSLSFVKLYGNQSLLDQTLVIKLIRTQI